mmetsp:Transcript_32125/g.92350  ORF Transcript_32125/g.92350 Transcript_32125/m.92350 type:complete len:218 (-) Transcript_32125:295-948(-)
MGASALVDDGDAARQRAGEPRELLHCDTRVRDRTAVGGGAVAVAGDSAGIPGPRRRRIHRLHQRLREVLPVAGGVSRAGRDGETGPVGRSHCLQCCNGGMQPMRPVGGLFGAPRPCQAERAGERSRPRSRHERSCKRRLLEEGAGVACRGADRHSRGAGTDERMSRHGALRLHALQRMGALPPRCRRHALKPDRTKCHGIWLCRASLRVRPELGCSN